MSQASGAFTNEVREPGSVFLGSSAAAQRVREFILRAAKVDCPVLILGESGTGKELVARQIHRLSERARAPFVAVNCAAIPDTLIESELFGHAAGAFTDARVARRGAFELADHGTFFLDEVGDLSPMAQPKLLRALESGEFVPVGSETPHKANLRVIAATNHNLAAMVKDGRFRADLYYRLDVIKVRIPPLRERLEDIPLLVEHFARQIASGGRREFVGIAPEAVEILRSYPWPGNIRELRAAVERALAMSSAGMLDASSFQLESMSSSGIDLARLLRNEWRPAHEQFERMYILRLLQEHGGNVHRAARAAGLSARGIYKILRRLNLEPGPPFR